MDDGERGRGVGGMGSESREAVLVALRLMRLALPLLDRSGRGTAAARLQHAIDDLCADAPEPSRPLHRP